VKKLLGILVLGLSLIICSGSAQAHHYEGEVEASKKFIKHHKKWAKKYHGMSDKKRFLKNVKEATGNLNATIKPKVLQIDGMTTESSMKSYKGKGEMGIVKGAPEHAWHGKEFWTVTADYSKCATMEWGFSDCKQSRGSVRKEINDKNINDKNKWTFVEGTEKWIHYAFKPVKNVVFKNKRRRFTIGQCHPGDNPHIGLTWMIRIRKGDLYVVQNFKHFKKADGTRYYIPYQEQEIFGAGIESSHILIKKLAANEFNGTDDWTSVLIHQIQSMDFNKGLLEIFLDGNFDNPAYVYKGEMGIKTKPRCYFKLGLYTNGNVTAKDMATTENMTIWLDAMAIGYTREEVMEKLQITKMDWETIRTRSVKNAIQIKEESSKIEASSGKYRVIVKNKTDSSILIKAEGSTKETAEKEAMKICIGKSIQSSFKDACYVHYVGKLGNF